MNVFVKVLALWKKYLFVVFLPRDLKDAYFHISRLPRPTGRFLCFAYMGNVAYEQQRLAARWLSGPPGEGGGTVSKCADFLSRFSRSEAHVKRRQLPVGRLHEYQQGDDLSRLPPCPSAAWATCADFSSVTVGLSPPWRGETRTRSCRWPRSIPDSRSRKKCHRCLRHDAPIRAGCLEAIVPN